MAKRPCDFTKESHHSKDRVTVYFGDPVPATFCGYHASPGWVRNAIAYVKGLRDVA